VFVTASRNQQRENNDFKNFHICCLNIDYEDNNFKINLHAMTLT